MRKLRGKDRGKNKEQKELIGEIVERHLQEVVDEVMSVIDEGSKNTPPDLKLISSGDKPRVTVLKAEEFGGEYTCRGWAYHLVLWLVSLLAMVTNYANAIYTKLFYKPKQPLKTILWKMGRDSNHISSFAFDRFSKFNHKAKVFASKWQSLELFYRYFDLVKPQLKDNLEGRLTVYWGEKLENRQAVTNRIKIVTKLLIESFKMFFAEPEIRLVSMASGSAPAVIQAMAGSATNKVKTVLVDVDRSALNEAARVAGTYNLKDQIQVKRGTTKELEKLCLKFKPHIVEMVGLLDYLPETDAIRVIRTIYDSLNPGGVLITGNIRPNKEKFFLDHVMLWPMIYRSESQFSDILIQGGFGRENVDIVYEPFMIHGIGVCKK